MSKGVFLFQRDLRLDDNTTLLKALQECSSVLAIFIFTPEQIDRKKNPYFSDPAVQFMCESLKDLNDQLKNRLHVFYGSHTTVLNQIYKEVPFDRLYSNQDYSVYAKERDQRIQEWCNVKKISFVQEEDYGLMPLKSVLVENERPYMVLSQFYKRFLKEFTVREPKSYPSSKDRFVSHRFSKAMALSEWHQFYKETPQLAIHGGRTEGLQRLKKLNELKDYQKERDYPALGKTSKMSPHLKFGTVSIREMYWAIRNTLGKDHGLIRELVFRDFYLKIYAMNPKLQRGQALHHGLDKAMPWRYSKKDFQQWLEGKTGFPLVDAGMRELNTTGHQHNRIRMLCASVLTKYLLIDWRWGLKYYYTHLVDADIFSNTAGWGFASSTGPDATPYFRAPFNPFLQSKKFDKDAVYIKQWIPELKEVDPKDIHQWMDPTIRAKYPNVNYPAPIIDAKEASARAINVYKEAFSKRIR